MRFLLAALLLFTALDASAQLVVSLSPVRANAGEPVVLRLEGTGCYSGSGVLRADGIVTVRLSGEDFLPCPPTSQLPRDVALGTFAAGTYRLDVVVCVPSPVDPCRTQSLELAVFGITPDAVFSVPTLDRFGIPLLLIVVPVLASKKFRE